LTMRSIGSRKGLSIKRINRRISTNYRWNTCSQLVRSSILTLCPDIIVPIPHLIHNLQFPVMRAIQGCNRVTSSFFRVLVE
jgi:hypothetical protein